jgi:hypothetical protein
MPDLKNKTRPRTKKNYTVFGTGRNTIGHSCNAAH